MDPWNLKKYKKILDETQEKINKDNFNSYLDTLEIEYQKYCKSFSPAYLAGSSWYVGPSIKTHILNDNKMSFNILKNMSIGCIFNYIKKK